MKNRNGIWACVLILALIALLLGTLFGPKGTFSVMVTLLNVAAMFIPDSSLK